MLTDGGGGGGGMSVKIDHAALAGAISSLSSLASSIDSQRARVESGTPVPTPSMGQLAPHSAWMKDQEPYLQGLHDIAVLLATHGGTVASFSVGTDINDIKQMLGETLADNVEMGNPNDKDASAKYLELFQRWQLDPATMASFQNTLGPENTLRTLSAWADAPADQANGEPPSDVQAALVAAMRQSLVTANKPGGFTDSESADFAHGLVDAATIDPDDYYGRGPYNPSGALNYLLYDQHFNDTFIKTVAEDLDQYERQDNDGHSGLWSNRPEQDLDFGDYMEPGTSDPYSGNMDPMTGLMSAMSHNPSVALDFFSEDDAEDGQTARAEYYIKERNWDRDNYNGISQVLDAATTDESLIHATGPDAEQIQQKAAMLASETVYYFNDRDNKGDLPEILHRFPENGAAEDFAHILSTYMPSVEDGMDNPTDLNGDGDRDDNVRPDAGGSVVDGFGDTAPMPKFYDDGLRNFMLMSTSTDEGLGELTQGINDWRGEKLGHLADQYHDAREYAEGRSDNASALDVDDAHDALRTGIQEDARLQGFLLGTMGDDEIHDAAEQDARTKATIGLFSDLADAVPIPGAGKLAEGAGKDLIMAGIDHARGAGADKLEDALAHAQDDAVTDWNDKAGATLNRENFAVASLLDSRDLSADPGAMHDVSRPGGSIISYDDYLSLSPSQQDLVENELFSTDRGVGGVMSPQDYREAYQSAFNDYFEKGQGDD
jgi:hypothetical protein